MRGVRRACASGARAVRRAVLVKRLYTGQSAVRIAQCFALAAGVARARVVAEGDGQGVIAGRGSAVAAVGVGATDSAMRCPLFGVAVPGSALGGKKNFAVAEG